MVKLAIPIIEGYKDGRFYKEDLGKECIALSQFVDLLYDDIKERLIWDGYIQEQHGEQNDG